jgi:hypothetical protein
LDDGQLLKTAILPSHGSPRLGCGDGPLPLRRLHWTSFGRFRLRRFRLGYFGFGCLGFRCFGLGRSRGDHRGRFHLQIEFQRRRSVDNGEILRSALEAEHFDFDSPDPRR